MTQIRTQTNAPSNEGRMLDIEVALEVLEMRLTDEFNDFARVAHLPYGAERCGRSHEQGIGRAVAVLAQPGDPSDALEALYAR